MTETSEADNEASVEARYEKKYELLLEYYDTIAQSNNRLRNRLYHVKKEINYLKQLKRVLCQRLLELNDDFVSATLEIPDNDAQSSVVDKVIGEVVNTAQTGGAPPAKKRRPESKKSQPSKSKPKPATSKTSLVSIVDDIITESHNEHVEAQALVEGIHLMEDLSAVNYEPLTENDLASEQLKNRLLRKSSIDHLLPDKPDETSDEETEIKPFDSSRDAFDSSATEDSDLDIPSSSKSRPSQFLFYGNKPLQERKVETTTATIITSPFVSSIQRQVIDAIQSANINLSPPMSSAASYMASPRYNMVASVAATVPAPNLSSRVQVSHSGMVYSPPTSTNVTSMDYGSMQSQMNAKEEEQRPINK
uniref:INO80 complex subunit E n=1 Tax=Acrobeloides nanus TaxID=290746 RepID=A0A914DGI7_9BILA